MATSIGSLFASLTLQSSQFIQGTQQAAQAANTMSGKITASFGQIAKGVAELSIIERVGEWLGEAVKSSAEYAASLNEIAARTGVTTKTFQEMNYVATQTGVSQETLERGLSKMTLAMGKAANGNKELQAAMKPLHLTMQDLKKDTPDQWLDGLIKGFAAIKDPAERARLEVLEFGKAGQQLDPMLKGGKESVEELRKAAEELGVVLSDKEIQGAEETAHKLEALNFQLKAQMAKIIGQNAGAIEGLATSLMKLVAAFAKFWSENPKGVMMILGALGGAAMGGMAGGPIGAAIGAVAGATGGYYLGNQMAWNNRDYMVGQVKDDIAHYNQVKSQMGSYDENGLPYADTGALRSAKAKYDKDYAQLKHLNTENAQADAMAKLNAFTGRDVTPPSGGKKKKGGGGSDGQSEVQKLQDDITDQKSLLAIGPNDIAALQAYNIQKETFKNLEAAGAKASKEAKQAITEETAELVKLKAQLDVKTEIDALQAQDDQLHMTAREQEIYNAFKAAHIPLSLEMVKGLSNEKTEMATLAPIAQALGVDIGKLSEIVAGANRNFKDDAIKKWKDSLKALHDEADQTHATSGMNEWDKQKADVLAAWNKAKNADGTPANTQVDPNAIVVTGKAVVPSELKQRFDDIDRARSDNAQKTIKDYQDQINLLSMTATEQDVFNALKQQGLTLDSLDGQELAAKVRSFDAMKTKMEGVQAIASDFASAIGTALTGLLEGTQTWGQAFKSMLTDISNKMIEDLVIKPMEKMIETGIIRLLTSVLGGGGTMLGSFSSVVGGTGIGGGSMPGLALGGPASAGSPFWVGEKGPELFVPQQNGAIIPNNRAGNDSGPVFNIDARGSSNPAETAALVQQGIMAAMPMIRQDATAFTFRKMGRPGL